MALRQYPRNLAKDISGGGKKEYIGGGGKDALPGRKTGGGKIIDVSVLQMRPSRRKI